MPPGGIRTADGGCSESHQACCMEKDPIGIVPKEEDEAKLQFLISAAASSKMSGKSTYFTWLRYFLWVRGVGDGGARGLAFLLTIMICAFLLICHSTCKGERLALMAIYLGSLFTRFDECVANTVYSMGRYDMVTHASTSFLQMFLWEQL